MSTFKRAWEIRDDIPPPFKAREVAEAMGVGSSILVDTEFRASNVAQYIRAAGGKCTRKKIPREGWRVWRTA